MKDPTDALNLSARGHVLLGLLTLLALIGGFGLWSATTTLSGAIIASGRIEVALNRQVVQHPDGGVVAEILVAEGGSVRAGDILLRLDGGLIKSELAIVDAQLVEVMARRARLEAERDGAPAMVVGADLTRLARTGPDVADQIDGQRRLFAARAETQSRTTEQLGKRRAQSLSQIDGITAQQRALMRQLALIDRELGDARTLMDKGLMQAPRVMGIEREQARLSGQSGELAAARAQAEGRVTEIDLEMLRLSAGRREEASAQLRDIGSTELELAERRRALATRVAQLDIRAPVSGTVLGLQVTTPRAVLRAADPVVYIIPQDRPLMITAQISPLHIDEVVVGQATRLVFPAFSARTTPELQGHVTVISADVLTDSATQASFYRVEIALAPEEAARLTHPLLPGMPVEAFIQTSQATPLAYLMKPFADYFNHAFRES